MKEKKKIRIGVIGGYRGSSMIDYCRHASDAELVAICDKNPEVLDNQRKALEGLDIAYYESFDDFIRHDGMDAVVLANYANEHAPFAVKAMNQGLHVFSEVLPVQTMKEAVELIETIESTGLVYAYGENYCYMQAPMEMRRLYREGLIGEFEYGEGEYIHNCGPIWHSITYGEPDHWRNNMYSTFYCTHSLGPIIHITGLRPVSVIGFEGSMSDRRYSMGAKTGLFGIEMVTLENGGIVKSIHGGLYKNSIWYTVYGSKGRMECAREDANAGHVDRLYVNYDDVEEAYWTEGNSHFLDYVPSQRLKESSATFGHGGSDFYSMYNFVKKINGDEDADTIDIYEALDMFLPGHFAYRSILDGGKSKLIPDLRDKSIRDLWRNDTACTVPSVAGDMLLPTSAKGTPEIPASVYEEVAHRWEKEKEASKRG
jgi:predicted dehydrogenase